MNYSIFLSILSGVLLTLSYPAFGFGFLAWFALAPLLLAVNRSKNSLQALGCGLIVDFVFFCFAGHWLLNVNILVWLLVPLKEAIYFMAFAWFAYVGIKSGRSVYFKAAWIALAWVVCEFLRSEIPMLRTGWSLLAYSQSPYVPIIQFASILGSYGLGFLIALVNAYFFYIWTARKDRKVILILFVVIAIVFVGLLGYGRMVLARSVKPESHLRISVIQGNIPQSVKWMRKSRGKILEIHEKLTRLAAIEKPDLIIWPEAAFPGYFNTDFHAEQVCALAKELKTPLLIGGLYWVTKEEVYNSAYFIEKDGAVIRYYNKLMLVPFAEYIPLKFLFGWLKPLAQAISAHDFSAGKEKVIFRWSKQECPFAVLICFEDVFHNLAKDLVDRGAKFLVVITNDARFGKTGAPYQHLQASIFRAVENGVPIIRAANTGVSAFISHQGRILAVVKDTAGDETFIAGQKTYELPLVNEKTFYRQSGYLFPYFSILIFLFLGLALLLKKHFTR
jgi:apolipoprotein N-acyltransferase